MIISIVQKLILITLSIVSFIYPQSHTVSLNISANPEQQEYKAMTYNIHRGQTKFGISSLNQIAKIIEKEQPDFVALQEVDRYHIRSGLQDQMKYLSDKLNMEYTFGSNLQYAITEYGNGILSKYPIIDSGQIKLAYETEPRSMLWAKIKTDEGIVYVTSIHLGFDRIKRPEHFKIIEDFTNQIDAPVLLMGDFNVLPTHNDFSQFRSKISGTLIHNETPTYFNNKPMQIDYIFGTYINETKSYTLPSNASDHYPLILKFKIDTNYKKSYTVMI